MSAFVPPSPRPTCYGCFRPLGLCFCDTLQPVNNRTHVVIVQHPRETFHPLNTVRIAEGSLRRVEVLRGPLPDLADQLERLALPPDAALLFPSPDAEDLEALPPDRRPSCVVVLDGTWHHARTLLRDLPPLAPLRRVRFTPPAPSEYRIRREPRAEYLSTIESIAHVLERLEPETPGVRTLRQSFRSLIDRALAARQSAPESGRAKRPRQREPRPPPPVLIAPPQHLLLVYAEGSADSASSGRHPLLVRTRRFGTGGASDQTLLLKTPTPPHPRLLEHLALTHLAQADGSLQGALDLSEARQRWATLVRPEDHIVAWHRSVLRVLSDAGLDAPRAVALKELYCNRPARRGVSISGGVDDLIRLEGLPLPRPTAPGRAVERLAQTEVMLQFLREEAARELSP